MSQTVHDQVGNRLGLEYRPLGRHRVKNIAQPVTVYAIGGAARSWPAMPGRATAAVIALLVLVNTGLIGWLLAGHGRVHRRATQIFV